MRGGVAIERVTGDLQRIVPEAGFPGAAPGETVRFEYLTPLLVNVSFAPTGPYVVFDDAPDQGLPARGTTSRSPSSGLPSRDAIPAS